MSTEFLTVALLLVSMVTTLTVEAIKKIFNKAGTSYSSNALAAIVAVIIALVVSVFYAILNGIAFDATVVIQTIVLMFFSFLSATVGYDKVVQLIEQLKLIKK